MENMREVFTVTNYYYEARFFENGVVKASSKNEAYNTIRTTFKHKFPGLPMTELILDETTAVQDDERERTGE